MIVVDSCGWLEVFARTSHGELYREALVDGADLLVPTICICEVTRRMAGERGEEAALRAAAVMSRGVVLGLAHETAIDAALLGRRYALPLADSIIYATAQRAGAIIWTHDTHFRELPGVQFIAAPAPG